MGRMNDLFKSVKLWKKLTEDRHMRIWSIHPKYLDSKGLVALWRETLLAKKVLEGRTSGYTNHPQLIRFKKVINPPGCINWYLNVVFQESIKRNYKFDRTKFQLTEEPIHLPVTKGQLDYEKEHLLKKLQIRNSQHFHQIKSIKTFDPHPLFKPVKGGVEDWEIIHGTI